MVEIEFNLNQSLTVIQARLDDKFKIAIDRFIQKNRDRVNTNNIYFLSSGKQINNEEIIKNQMTDLDKRNKKMKVLVHMLEKENKDKEQIIIKSKDIICPKCYEPCRIKFENYKIKLFGCINNHVFHNIKLSDFPNTQKINISRIICDICKIKNKGNSPNYEFYRCLTCNINICLLCKHNHNQNHNIIKYEQINYICKKHNDVFDKYCGQCNLNICFSCEDHEIHKNTISLRELKPDVEEKKKILFGIKTEIEYFNKKVKKIMFILNELVNTMNVYYEINNDILNSYEIRKRNYQMLSNIKEISINNDIFEKIKNINRIDNINDKILNLFDLYNKMNLNNNDVKSVNIEKDYYAPKKIIENIKDIKEKKLDNKKNSVTINIPKKDKLNEMTIIYDIKDKDGIYIFGTDFVKANKNNCYILIDGKKNELCDYLDLNKEQQEKDILEIKLIENKPITNMSYMFSSSLISLPDISEWDTRYVTDMSFMFGSCNSLKSLPDISKWNTKNVKDMNSMFNYCTSLKSLPDISKWNIKNVTNISSMFYGCNTLKSLPDISKWDTKNITDMSYLFSECSSLKSFPDISKWELNEDVIKDYMFDGCNERIIPEKFKDF